MSAWYDQTPARYAKGLRFSAERCDEQAAHCRTRADMMAAHDLQRSERNARRLRAMAALCDLSKAPTAGGVDFLGMTNPCQSREDEDAAIATVEAMLRESATA